MSEPPSILHKHPKSRNFTQVENVTIRDSGLSFRATGILVYLLALPGGSPVDSTALSERKKEGRDAIRKALKELERLDYIERVRKQGDDGRWRTTTHVYEIPKPEKPASVDRASDSQALSLPGSKTEKKEGAGVACIECGETVPDLDALQDHREAGCTPTSEAAP